MSQRVLWSCLLAGVVSLAFVACGQSTCDRAEAVNKALSEKSKPCASADGGVSVSATLDRNKCESGVKSCTEGDLKIINAQHDCLDKVATCSKGNELPWFGAVLACATDSNKLTPACATAVNGN